MTSEEKKLSVGIADFANIDAYTLGDAARNCAVGGVIQRIGPQTSATKFVGRALTARIEYTPNGSIPLARYGGAAFLDRVSPGDAVFLDGGGQHLSALGDLAFAMVQRRGGTAAIVNGGVRDIEDADPSFPVFAVGVAILSFAGRGFITGIGEPISVDGIRISTGDVVAGSRGGLVVVPWAERDKVLREARTIIEIDRRMREGIAQGQQMTDLWRQHKS